MSSRRISRNLGWRNLHCSHSSPPLRIHRYTFDWPTFFLAEKVGNVLSAARFIFTCGRELNLATLLIYSSLPLIDRHVGGVLRRSRRVIRKAWTGQKKRSSRKRKKASRFSFLFLCERKARARCELCYTANELLVNAIERWDGTTGEATPADPPRAVSTGSGAAEPRTETQNFESIAQSR